jgi:hypothetical protein
LTVNPHLGWRWTEYIEAIWVFATLLMCAFALPEIYGPVLLKRKAQRLRKETGNEALYHPAERIKLSPKTIATKHFARPLRMLITEPMVTCIAFYASFVYALLYLTLEVFPVVFQKNRHWSPVIGSLPFIGLFIGVCLATFVNLGNQARYARISDAAHGKPVPEARLAPMAIGGFLFAIGLFCRCLGEILFLNLAASWFSSKTTSFPESISIEQWLTTPLPRVWMDSDAFNPLAFSCVRNTLHRRGL